jgi:hypothetical protein
MLDPTNGIRARVMNLSHKNIILRERLLRRIHFDLLKWTVLRICLARFDFKCLKRFWLPSLDIN